MSQIPRMELVDPLPPPPPSGELVKGPQRGLSGTPKRLREGHNRRVYTRPGDSDWMVRRGESPRVVTWAKPKAAELQVNFDDP